MIYIGICAPRLGVQRRLRFHYEPESDQLVIIGLAGGKSPLPRLDEIREPAASSAQSK
jgi:hypothetical protein